MNPRCRNGCGNTVAITGSKCGACIRAVVDGRQQQRDDERRAQLRAGLDKVRAALAEAKST